MAHKVLNFSTDGTPRRLALPKVYSRETWAGDWAQTSYLHPTEMVWSAGASLSTATLQWRYGKMIQHDAAVSFTETLLAWSRNRFVKIEHRDKGFVGVEAATRIWYGVLGASGDQQGGAHYTPAGAETAHGLQTLTCYGLEKLLADHEIRTSYFEKEVAGAQKTERCLVFNEGGKPNRSKVKVGGAYIFARDTSAATSDFWSTKDIVEYLLTYQSPRNAADTVNLDFELHDPDNAAPNWDRPQLAQDRRTTFSLIDRLLNRRRLLHHWMNVDEDTGKIFLCVATGTDAAIAVGVGGFEINANPNTRELIFDEDTLTNGSIQTNHIEQCDQCIARGARRRSVGTFGYRDNTLVVGWTAAAQAKYLAGASGNAGYSALSTLEKQRADAEVRSRPELSDVFATHKIPQPFGGKTGDGFGGAQQSLFPIGLDPVAADPYLVYQPTLYVEQTTPLIEGVDYSGDIIKNELINLATGNGEERRPLAVLYDETAARWVRCDQWGSTAHLEAVGDTLDRRFSMFLRVPPKTRTIHLRVTGAPQHAAASYLFNELSADEPIDGPSVTLNMACTLSLADDRYTEGAWPVAPAAAPEFIRRKIIDAGDGYFLHYVAPNTIVDVDADGGLVYSTGGFIESHADVVDRLKAIARVAFEYYGSPRQIVSIETKRFPAGSSIELGDLVTAVGDDRGERRQTVRSPVTSIRISIPWIEGNAMSEPKYTLKTSAGELDPLQVLPANLDGDLAVAKPRRAAPRL